MSLDSTLTVPPATAPVPIVSRNACCVTKRYLDLLIAVPLTVICLPAALLIMVVIKLVDGGPAVFVQQREGLHGKFFGLIKFRTMYLDSDERLQACLAADPARQEEWEQNFKLVDDPRLLPVIGAFLRRTSLDELPNLINILRGELSLVGPRPFPEYHLAAFDAEFRETRRSIRPGLTGLWQLERGGVDVQRRADTEYADNWSLWLDIRILARTVPMVLLARKKHY